MLEFRCLFNLSVGVRVITCGCYLFLSGGACLFECRRLFEWRCLFKWMCLFEWRCNWVFVWVQFICMNVVCLSLPWPMAKGWLTPDLAANWKLKLQKLFSIDYIDRTDIVVFALCLWYHKLLERNWMYLSLNLTKILAFFKDIFKLKNPLKLPAAHKVLNLELNGIFGENLPCTCRVSLNNYVKTTCNSSKRVLQKKSHSSHP